MVTYRPTRPRGAELVSKKQTKNLDGVASLIPDPPPNISNICKKKKIVTSDT